MNRCGAATLFLLVCAASVQAQSFELLDNKVPIAEHLKRNSNVKLVPPTGAESVVPDTVLLPDVDSQPAGIGTYDVVPRCDQSRIRREPLMEYTDGSEAIDILYYDHDDAAQVKRAETWPGLAVPFLNSAAFNPFAEQDRLQCFARVLTLHCLPTRFRFTEFQGKRVSEFREGMNAWDLDAN